METKFNNVPWTAPLFRGTPLEVLEAIVDRLDLTSYHYADDSTREWGKARTLVQETAQLINTHLLSFEAIQCLYLHKAQLVTFAELINAVLKDLRK